MRGDWVNRFLIHM